MSGVVNVVFDVVILGCVNLVYIYKKYVIVMVNCNVDIFISN